MTVTVLPTYNEAGNIRALIERLLGAVEGAYAVVVVDDDSPDGTWRIVADIAAERGGETGDVCLIRRVDERGLTSALRRGIAEAIRRYDADVITWMDCDLSMPPEDLPRLLACLANDGADVAVGSRWIADGADVAHGLMARTLSRLINLYAAAVIGSQVHDYTSGFVAARTEVLRELPLEGDYGEYCIGFLAAAVRRGYTVTEIPYVCVPREAGASKTGLCLRDYLCRGRKYVATAWRHRRFGGARQGAAT